MLFEKTTGDLRKVAELVFHIAEQLTGNTPTNFRGWYKIVVAPNSGVAWVRFIGD